MYKSPINVSFTQYVNDVVTAEENAVVSAVVKCGIDVDKDELVKALRYDRNQYIQGYTDAEPHWIPCSERLPEFDVKVLAYVKNKDPEGRFNEDGVYTAELKDKVPVHDPEGKKNIWGIPGYDSEWTVWAWSYFTEPNVLAWMPLPKPYEEEE